MTTILPAARSSWDVIGEKIGSNLSQNLPRAVEKGYERQTGMNAIDQLQKDLAASEGDLGKMIPAIARAYTANPSLERSGIAEKLIPLAQRKSGTEDFPAGGGMPTKMQPGAEPGAPERKVPVSATELVPPRQGIIADPQGTQQFQLPYGPQEFSQARQKARELGYMPEQEERFINDMKEYNDAAAAGRNYEIQNYQQKQQERKDTLENQSAFRDYVRENSKEFASNPDEMELALKAADKYQGEKSFADRLSKVKNEIRPYQAAKKALSKSLERPLFGQSKDQLEMNQRRAQKMVDMGQKDQLRLMIANGGHGQVEEALLLNPLDPKLDKQLSQFIFSDPFEKVTSIDPESKEYNEQLQRGKEFRQKQVNGAEQFLSRSIKPGTYDKPGTNLLLTRKHLMDGGMSWETAGQTIDKAIANGKIKLDPHQEIDHMKLGYPPLQGDTYLDTVLNNVFFPITGKE